MELIFYLLVIIITISIPLVIYFLKKPNDSSSIKDLYAEGLDMLVMGKRKIAYKNFKSIIEKDSSNIKAYLHLGQVVREGGNYNKALEIHQNLLLRKNLRKYDKIELLKNLSYDYYFLGNLEKAIDYNKQVLVSDNSNDWANKHLIKLYKENDDWENATEHLQSYYKTNKKINSNRLALYKIQEGRILLKNNDFELARKIFEEAFELSRDLNVSYYFIGNAFAAESNVIYDKAIELEKNLNGSLEKNDQSQKLKIDAEGMLGKAIPMWGYYIENMPEYSWMILPTLKDALQALNRYDDIEKLLITANKKNKKNVDILSHLADYYANKGDVDKALSTINNALDINKNSLIAQLKKLKINSLKNKENSLSNELDKLIFSLLRDKRYIKYKQSYNDENMKWLFETNDIT